MPKPFFVFVAGSESMPQMTRLREKKNGPRAVCGFVVSDGSDHLWGTSEVLDEVLRWLSLNFLPKSNTVTQLKCVTFPLPHFLCHRRETLRTIPGFVGVSNDLTTAHIIGSTCNKCQYHVTKSKNKCLLQQVSSPLMSFLRQL